MASTASPITTVPIGTPMFNTAASTGGGGAIGNQESGVANTANLTRVWILFFESLLQQTGVNPVVGFIINSGVAGTNVGPMLPAARSGSANVVTVVVKASDPSTPLTFRINQWTQPESATGPDWIDPTGTDIFATDPTVPAGTAIGTVLQFDDFTAQPLPITENDLFSIDITSGSGSWVFVAVLETSAESGTAT
jgi:hypothetical protein